MDKLWAPWRINYIKNSKKTKGCLFCGILKKNRDKSNLLVYRSTYSFCLLNKFPYNNGHVLICPNRHIKDLSQLKDIELLDLFKTLNLITKALKRTLKPQGFNIGINAGRVAGAGIPDHIHLHIVPRWNEDTNFMPVIFNTKVISQSLDELYEKLYRQLRG